MSDSDLMNEWVVVHRERNAPGNQPDSAAASKTPHKSDLRETKEFRYACAAEIQGKIRSYNKKFRLTAVNISTILFIPISCLEHGGLLDHTMKDEYQLKVALDNIAILVGHYLRKSHEDLSESKEEPETASLCTQQQDETHDAVGRRPLKRKLSTRETSRKRHSHRKYTDGEEDDDAAGNNDNTNGETHESNQVGRSGTEKTRCCIRDKFQCVFTGTSCGGPVHILPFAWNKDEVNKKQTICSLRGGEAFFDMSVLSELSRLLGFDLGWSDKFWNMVYVNDQLCSKWPLAYFGLKCLSVKPKQYLDFESSEEPDFEVAIQLNWLHRLREKPTKLMYLEDDDNEMREMAEMQIKHEDDAAPPPTDFSTTIISGHTVALSMPESDALKCRLMLDLHWNLTCIAAMSGGAEHPDLLPEPVLWAGYSGF
ncbi:hypothetical protein FPSE5266_09769 [Fusarium pseudograminearum]|nr:hypothetical protein FPSE5266_09769 [Fusarium pseudograminearum]